MGQTVYVVHVESVGEADFGGPEIYGSFIAGVYTKKEMAEEVADSYIQSSVDPDYTDRAYITETEVV